MHWYLCGCHCQQRILPGSKCLPRSLHDSIATIRASAPFVLHLAAWQLFLFFLFPLWSLKWYVRTQSCVPSTTYVCCTYAKCFFFGHGRSRYCTVLTYWKLHSQQIIRETADVTDLRSTKTGVFQKSIHRIIRRILQQILRSKFAETWKSSRQIYFGV